MDVIDILLQLGILVSFVVFAVAVWVIKKDVEKKKRQKDQGRQQSLLTDGQEVL